MLWTAIETRRGAPTVDATAAACHRCGACRLAWAGAVCGSVVVVAVRVPVVPVPGSPVGDIAGTAKCEQGKHEYHHSDERTDHSDQRGEHDGDTDEERDTEHDGQMLAMNPFYPGSFSPRYGTYHISNPAPATASKGRGPTSSVKSEESVIEKSFSYEGLLSPMRCSGPKPDGPISTAHH